MQITINGRERHVPKRKLDYDQLVCLAFGPTGYVESVYTITHWLRGGQGGTLTKGQRMTIKPGMVFTVVQTNKA